MKNLITLPIISRIATRFACAFFLVFIGTNALFAQCNLPPLFGGSNGPQICGGGMLNLTATTIPGATYMWTGPGGFSSNQQNPSLSNVSVGASGLYLVQAKVGACVTNTANVAINVNAKLQLSLAKTDVAPGFGGTITATAVGGTAPYLYMVNSQAISSNVAATFNGLAAGNYNVTVTDIRGCTASGVISVGQANCNVTLSATKKDVSCKDGMDGMIDITVSGGLPPYKYNWSNGATTQDISGLSIGNYTGVVTDANNCTASGTISIMQPEMLDVALSANDATCADCMDGLITAHPSGGTPAYQYRVNNMSWQFENVLPNLGPGTYDVSVRDFKGCMTTRKITISSPDAPICGVPGGLNITNITTTGAKLNWSSVSGAMQYEISLRAAGGAWNVVGYVTGTTYTFNNLTTNMAYQIRLRTMCSNGLTSFYSATSAFITSVPTCNAPSQPMLAGATSQTALINWDFNPTEISGFEFSYREVGPNLSWSIINTTNNNVLVISGLSANKNYMARVRTRCLNNTFSTYSPLLLFSTNNLPPCPVPGTPLVSNISGTTAQLSWNLGGPGPLHFEVSYRKESASAWTTFMTATNSGQLNNLAGETVYLVRVRKICDGDVYSDFTPVVAFSTGIACDKAPLPASVSVASNGATLAWTSVNGATAYEVNYRPAGSSVWQFMTVPGVTAQITGLNPNSTYQYRLRTVCGSSLFSPYSNVFSFSTLTECKTPQNFSVNPGLTTATFSWALVPEATSYKLGYRRNDAQSEWIETSLPGTTPAFTTPNLMPGTEYLARISSTCLNSNSATSPLLLFSTAEGRLGAETQSTFDFVSVYPNPNKGAFTLRVGLQKATTLKVSVYDLLGRTAIEKTFTATENVSEWPLELNSGFYLLEVIADGQKSVQKVVVE